MFEFLLKKMRFIPFDGAISEKVYREDPRYNFMPPSEFKLELSKRLKELKKNEKINVLVDGKRKTIKKTGKYSVAIFD